MSSTRSSAVFCALAALVALSACSPQAQTVSTQKTSTAVAATAPAGWPYPLDVPAARGEHGMVVTDAPLATKVGVDVMQQGGNAVDAAVATAFALAVVLPSAGNVGGGGFAVVHVNGADAALDFRETAPAAATRDMYLDASGTPTDRSITGHLASGVPGSVAGLWALHRKFGSKPWRDLVAPAIRLAQDGYDVDADFARLAGADLDRLSRYPASAALFTDHGKALAAGARWKDADLASTLKRVADGGADGFYRGPTADLIAAEMERGHGLITRRDLESYQPKWRDPLVFTYRDHRIVSMPPPSSGGIALALIARQLGAFDLASLGWHSAEAIHLEAEAMRRAFAVRNELLGDPDFVQVPQAMLMAPAYADALRASISQKHATPSREVSPPTGAGADGRHTTHFSVVDGSGNAVAVTTTLNGDHGSAVTVAGAGFLMNNEMDDFTSKPGSPNMFGLVMGDANAIAPGKRMLSSMTPTIVFDGTGAPVLVTGASGGPLIITTVFQLISNRLDYSIGVSPSMSAPRIHHQHLPDQIGFEAHGLDEATVRRLEALGHHVVPFKDFFVDGWTVAATIERRGTQWEGTADPRLHGNAGGY